ncbi:MAG: TIGR01777 family oxidoreductase [Verrucomicrobiota bacterium]
MVVGITGASGFIGGHIRNQAAERGLVSIGFSRNANRELDHCDSVRGFQQDAVPDLAGLDAIIHLAGESILGVWTDAKKQRIYDSRILTTRRIFEGLEKLPEEARPKTLISASAVGIYGDSGDEWVDESAATGEGFLAKVTHDWEAEATRVAELGVRVATVRIGFVVGKEGALPLMARAFQFGAGGNLGSGEQWMPWVHAADLAGTFLFALENTDISGTINAVAPTPATNAVFTKAVGSQLNRPTLFPAPSWALKALPGGMSEIFLYSMRVKPSVLQQAQFEWRYPELDDAIAAALSPNT